jgi:hypothetical protein
MLVFVCLLSMILYFLYFWLFCGVNNRSCNNCYSSIYQLWVNLVSFAVITFCVASQRVFIFVSVYFSLSTQSGDFWIHCRIVWHRQGLWPTTWQTLPLDREDAPWYTKSQLSWQQPGHESGSGSTPRRTELFGQEEFMHGLGAIYMTARLATLQGWMFYSLFPCCIRKHRLV